MNDVLDVFIIGGGPIGLACGIEAKKVRLNYLIVEKGALVNSLYNYPLNMTFFSTSERLEIGGVPFVSIAANRMLRNSIGIEIVPEYYKMVKAQLKPVELFLLEPKVKYGNFEPERRRKIR